MSVASPDQTAGQCRRAHLPRDRPASAAGRSPARRQVPLDVPGEIAGRLVAPRAILLKGLHHDPVQVAVQELAELDRVRLAFAEIVVRLRPGR